VARTSPRKESEQVMVESTMFTHSPDSLILEQHFSSTYKKKVSSFLDFYGIFLATNLSSSNMRIEESSLNSNHSRLAHSVLLLPKISVGFKAAKLESVIGFKRASNEGLDSWDLAYCQFRLATMTRWIARMYF